MSTVGLVTDAEIDSATPEMLKDAAYIIFLIAAKGYKELTKAFEKYTKVIVSKPQGYSELMTQFQKNILDNSAKNKIGLELQLAISQLEGEGLLHTISQKVNVLNQLKQRFGQDIIVSKVKSNNIKFSQGNLELHGFEITKSNGNKFHHDVKILVNGKNIKSSQTLAFLKQRESLMKYIQSEENLANILQNNQQNVDKTAKIQAKEGPTQTTQKTLSSLARRVKIQASFGAAMQAVVNYQLLLDKKFLQYTLSVAKGASVGTAQALIEDRAAKQLGEELAGPVAGLVVSLLFATKAAKQTGDWERFGKDMGANAISSAASYYAGILASAKLASWGIVAGPWYFAGMAVVGVVTFFGTQALTKYITPLGKMTEMQMKKVYENYCKQFEKEGLILKESYEEFAKNYSSGNFKIGTMFDWKKLAQDPSACKTNLSIGAFRESIRYIFTVAKYTSMNGNIRIGLKLLIKQLEDA